jgi:hypothetical protein
MDSNSRVGGYLIPDCAGQAKVIEKTLEPEAWPFLRWGVLGIVPLGGPNKTFAKPIESFFELSIGTVPSLSERDCHAKKES